MLTKPEDHPKRDVHQSIHALILLIQPRVRVILKFNPGRKGHKDEDILNGILTYMRSFSIVIYLFGITHECHCLCTIVQQSK